MNAHGPLSRRCAGAADGWLEAEAVGDGGQLDRVDDAVDVVDAVMSHREREQGHGPAAAQRQDAGVVLVGGEREQGGRRAGAEEPQKQWGDAVAAGDHPSADGAADVGLAGDVGVEDGQQPVEVASGYRRR